METVRTLFTAALIAANLVELVDMKTSVHNYLESRPRIVEGKREPGDMWVYFTTLDRMKVYLYTFTIYTGCTAISRPLKF